MSLDNIQIPGELIKDLYTKSLVSLETIVEKSKSDKTTVLTFLGKNEKNILILVQDENAVFLADEELNFLMGILSACNRTMADVALVNSYKKTGINYKSLIDQFSPGKILFLGTEPVEMDFPLQFPHYQVQKYNHQTYLSAPALKIISKDIAQKKELWTCLKKIFEIG